MVSWACPVAQLLTEELTDLSLTPETKLTREKKLTTETKLTPETKLTTETKLTPETKLTTEKKSTPHFYCNMDILYYDVKCVATLE